MIMAMMKAQLMLLSDKQMMLESLTRMIMAMMTKAQQTMLLSGKQMMSGLERMIMAMMKTHPALLLRW